MVTAYWTSVKKKRELLFAFFQISFVIALKHVVSSWLGEARIPCYVMLKTMNK